MEKMKLHSTHIQINTEGRATVLVPPTKDLGKGIIELRYDLMAPVLKAMADEAWRQAESDKAAGRPLLAAQGRKLYAHLFNATAIVEGVAHQFRRHIEAEKAEIERQNEVIGKADGYS